MELVIKLPKEDYKRLKEQGMFGRVDVFKKAIREATPLPDGHGRLIDADKIIHTEVYDDEYEEFIEKTMTVNEFIEAYTDEGLPPTIIEAYKEGGA